MNITDQQLRQIIKEEFQAFMKEQDELAGPTTAGAKRPAPKPDTLAGPTTARDQPADTLAGPTAAQQTKEMARKYAQVKQVLAKLVSEL